ncbi:MAG: undecaprenyl/decaprenyl-phosphate alpha-N-acetylglucosaminyl 1-phosphate transferase [Planctomycetes bacterium]|nr:undecaprenyl/decaprenyl-phosphate alpha-N-acetylglucosaminyl 1-phosphate transferase [Planctomycetota bacterium]
MKRLRSVVKANKHFPQKHYVLTLLLFLFLVLPGTRSWFIMQEIRWLYIFIFALLINYICTPIVLIVATRLNIVDKPDKRKVHKTPIPLLGGVGVYISFAVTIIYNNVYSLELKGLAIGASIVFFIELIDDIKPLPALLKLFIQTLAVSIMIRYGVVADFLPSSWWGQIIEIAITIIWMLGITNSLNFFDGMDGLAAGITIISSTFLGILAIQTNQTFLMFLSIALTGSALGFLPYNFRYKKSALIFLGDAGSTFMGFLLAGMVVMGDWGGQTPVKAYAMPILILGILIFDMIYTTASRILSGRVTNMREWLDYTGKDHLHHRLTDIGLSHKQTVLFIYFLVSSLGLSALVLNDGSLVDALLLLFQAVTIYLVIVILMVKKKH